MKMQSRQNTMDFVKRNLHVMHLTILLTMAVTFAVVVRFMYGYLDYLPLMSVMVFLASLAVMSGAVFGLSKMTTKRALEALETYGARLNAFLETSRDVHSVAHSDVLIEKILDAAVALTGADGGALLTVDDDDIEFRYVRGANADALKGKRLPRGKGIVGAVIETGAPVRIDDAKKDERHFGKVDEQTGYVTRSILCVPLIMNGRRTGALELVKSEAGHFTADDVDLLKYFAEQAAIAVRNSEFREDMRNLESHLMTLLVEVNEKKTGKRGHARMTAKYSLMIGRDAGLSDEELQALYRAALLHDIGALRMDLATVKTEEEYCAHSVLGYEILRNISCFRDIASVVLHHHERYDGAGFPHGLKGEMIPLASRIIAIAGRFDVVSNTGGRAGGRQAGSDGIDGAAGKAVTELRAGAGKRYDPRLADLFLSRILREGVDETATVPYQGRCAASPAA